ncbi:hypothetical protein WG66_003930, partial [Moniliophthora roreri]
KESVLFSPSRSLQPALKALDAIRWIFRLILKPSVVVAEMEWSLGFYAQLLMDVRVGYGILILNNANCTLSDAIKSFERQMTPIPVFPAECNPRPQPPLLSCPAPGA